MPITKQSIKRVRRDKKAAERNSHFKHHMKSMIKLLMKTIQGNDMTKAQKTLKNVVSAIDTAAKKNLIHKNNAARKKSRLQKTLTKAMTAGPKAEPKPKVKKEEKKKGTKKEAESKK